MRMISLGRVIASGNSTIKKENGIKFNG